MNVNNVVIDLVTSASSVSTPKLDLVVDVPKAPDVLVGIPGAQGPPGPTGPQGDEGPVGPAAQWTQLTQAAYDALSPKDPNTLYVIV